jgi:hypothetical protein
MANYYGKSRSNYFKVKDVDKFKNFLNSMYDMEFIEDGQGRVGFLVTGEGGSIPCEIWDEESDEYVDLDFDALLAQHLQDDQVAIYQEVGAEKLRYLVGYSVAVNAKGETAMVSINDIYSIAKEKLGGVDVTPVEY